VVLPSPNSIMEMHTDPLMFGDLLAYTPVAGFVRRWRADRVNENTKVEQLRSKIRPILAAIRREHPDLFRPAWV
jgi:hypothetical protein